MLHSSACNMGVTWNLPSNVSDMTMDELNAFIFDLGYALAEAKDIRKTKK